MVKELRPVLCVVAGPNGSGKTSTTEKLLANDGLFWKSHATPELVAKIETGKYVLHLPFNRQIKKMKQNYGQLEGLDRQSECAKG